MTSEIVAIYDTVEAMTVLVDGMTPTVYGLTGIPNGVVNADLPCRILLDLAQGGEGESMQFVTVNSGIGGGGEQYIDWRINDLMLLKPLGLGIGSREVTQALIAYTSAYIDAVRSNRNLLETDNNSASFTNLNVTPGTYEYPAESGHFFWGVMATSTIREIIS
ncbi:MAG: hypothetical protein LCI00_16835 [Chloroflexi bacterium]|nr:hypothetical protein [Chloroflexota bacterium]